MLIARNGLREPTPPVIPPETPATPETKPVDGDVVPVNAPPILLDELAPLRWHPLLTVPPEKLVWGNWPNAQMTFDVNTSRLMIDTPDTALLTLGDIDPADFRLQMEFSKSAWIGDVGFFLGYQAADPAAGRPMAVVQILSANSHEEIGKKSLRLEHELWRLESRQDLSRPLINRSVLAGVVVTRPEYGREASLEVSVRDQQIANVRWCGQDIPELVNAERFAGEPPPPITGALGIVAGHGAAIVSDVRLLLTREKGPAREP